MAEDRSSVVKKLSELIETNATDDEIVPWLAKLKDICKKIGTLGECHFHLLISPSIMGQLAKSGFFQTQSGASEIEGSMRNFVNNLFSAVTSLTEDQKQRLEKIIEEHEILLSDLRSEREELNEEISSYFSGVNQLAEAKKNHDLPKLLQIMSSLEYVRKNMSEETCKFEETLDKIYSVLTPRQCAEFQVKVAMWHTTIVQLKKLWDTFTSATQHLDSPSDKIRHLEKIQDSITEMKADIRHNGLESVVEECDTCRV